MYLGCFVCPGHSDAERSLDEECPACGREYGFPLTTPPEVIGELTVEAPLSRGFYGATYVVTRQLGQKAIAKVVPTAVHAFFDKDDFQEECRRHAEAAQGSSHVVHIHNTFDTDVTFGEVVTLPCHVAVMDFVEGPTLEEFLSSAGTSAMTKIAQVAIDLCALLGELEAKEIHHNDLHAGNLIVESLSPDFQRAHVVDASVRVVAIDLGSLSSTSKSDPLKGRLGDRRSVAVHLSRLMEHLTRDPEGLSDIDFRLARAIDMAVAHLTPADEVMTRATFEELMEEIYSVIYRVSSPWNESLIMRSFDHLLNAQNMESWFVPLLFVDPGENWLKEVSDAGPTLITGMRGCGKTMLLRSLEVHARLRPRPDEEAIEGFERVDRDGFIGLYFPSTPLLDVRGEHRQVVEHPDARLFVGMASQALRAVRHLSEVSPASVRPGFAKELGTVVGQFLSGSRKELEVDTDFELERALVLLQTRIGTNDPQLKLSSSVSQAFDALARVIRESSASWGNHRVFFLLDDVSTRYLSKDRVRDLLQGLIFQSEVCAFKLTTEEQSLQQVVPADGHIGTAREGRDYRIFNLGAEVHRILMHPRRGEQYLDEILQHRARYHPMHPEASPSELIGSPETIGSIASRAVETSRNSALRKAMYFGMTTLTRVSAGDIGDSIRLYKRMLTKAGGNPPIVSAEHQNEIYLMHCGESLVRLERGDASMQEVAVGFASAVRQALVDSEAKTKSARGRYREHARVLLRLTESIADDQLRRIYDLVDARIFVLQTLRGARKKGLSDEPFRQVALVYRKLFGLDQFIGMGTSDRFELSAEQTELWLNNPSRTKEILLGTVGSDSEREATADFPDLSRWTDTDADVDGDAGEAQRSWSSFPRQRTLYQAKLRETPTQMKLEFPSRMPEVNLGSRESLGSTEAFVCGLGFEDRALESVRRCLDMVSPARAVLLKYESAGYGSEIERLVRERVSDVDVVAYDDAIRNPGVLGDHEALLDVTGLAKPAIFRLVREGLLTRGRVHVSYAQALSYAPRESDVARILAETDPLEVAERMHRLDTLMEGEGSEFSLDPVFISNSSDESRPRVLSAMASPKYLRLFYLLEERDFDHLELIVQKPASSLGEMAEFAAVLAESKVPSSNTTHIETSRMDGLLKVIEEQSALHYEMFGSNLEFGLTGSKMHAAACAAASTVTRPSAVWYVKPNDFNEDKYSHGTGRSHFLTLTARHLAQQGGLA